MARELTIRNWCDMHLYLSDGQDYVEGDTYRVDVTVIGEPESPKPFVVELCPEHGSELAKAVTALVSLGRPPEDKKNQSGRKIGPAPTDACPICRKPARNRDALRAHLRTEHDQTMAGAGLEEATHVCEECGEGYSSGTGLASHRRARHPAGKRTRKQTA